jgi:hypothetical protein
VLNLEEVEPLRLADANASKSPFISISTAFARVKFIIKRVTPAFPPPFFSTQNVKFRSIQAQHMPWRSLYREPESTCSSSHVQDLKRSAANLPSSRSWQLSAQETANSFVAARQQTLPGPKAVIRYVSSIQRTCHFAAW